MHSRQEPLWLPTRFIATISMRHSATYLALALPSATHAPKTHRVGIQSRRFCPQSRPTPSSAFAAHVPYRNALCTVHCPCFRIHLPIENLRTGHARLLVHRKGPDDSFALEPNMPSSSLCSSSPSVPYPANSRHIETATTCTSLAQSPSQSESMGRVLPLERRRRSQKRRRRGGLGGG